MCCVGILGELSQRGDGRETDPVAGQHAAARSRGQERPGRRPADSSDLFLIPVMRAHCTDHVAR